MRCIKKYVKINPTHKAWEKSASVSVRHPNQQETENKSRESYHADLQESNHKCYPNHEMSHFQS